VQGVVKDIVDRADLGHLSGVHHGDSVGDLRYEGDVVGDHQDSDAVCVAHLAQLVQQFGLNNDIQGGRGLVGDNEVGVEHQPEGDHHALTHAARELVGVIWQPATLDAQALGEPADALEGRFLAGVGLVYLDRLDDMLVDALHRIERGHRILKDHARRATAEIAQTALIVGHDVLAVKDDLPAGDLAWRRNHAQKRLAQRALATATLAHQAEDLATLDVEGDVLHGAQVAEARVIGDGEVANLEQRALFVHAKHSL